MKTRFTALLMALLMCLGLAACGDDDVPPEPPTESKVESQAEDSQVDDGDEPETLRIVTDIDCLSGSSRINWDNKEKSQAVKGKSAFNRMLKSLGGTPNGLNVELEILPMDHKSGAYDSELTHLRTEIMAGKGPDVFLMSGFGGCDPALPENTLFQNPEAAMKKGLFLALDDYIENAQFMDWEGLQQTVMAAGQYEGKQYILPMFYRMGDGYLPLFSDQPLNEELAENLPASLEEVINHQDSEIRGVYAASIFGIGFRELAFEEIADSINEELLLDKDVLFQRTKDILKLYEAMPGTVGYHGTVTSSWLDGVSGGSITETTSWDAAFFPLRNEKGGVTAAVENWCAVNANTEHPEDAFFIADIFLGRDFQRLENFWQNRNGRLDTGEIAMFELMGQGSIPVYKTIGIKSTFHNSMTYADIRAALAEAEEEISFVYLTSNIDRELDSMFYELMMRVESGDFPTDDEIRKATDQCHMTVRMMLAES